MDYNIMYSLIYKPSQASSRPRNEFGDLTWLFSDSEIAEELGPDMVPLSWEPTHEIEQENVCFNDSWASN